MKYLFIILLFISSIGFGQSTKDIVNVLKSGDASQVSSYFAGDLEICLVDAEDFYSKDEATDKLAAFYTKFPPKSIANVHSGSSKGKSGKYISATYITKTGEKFKIYTYLNNNKIEELRFDPE